MIIEEKQYTEQEYDGLVRAFIQSPNIDEELQFVQRYALFKNRNFYLLMFRTVAKIRNEATQSNDNSLISALAHFESKLHEYTNVIPTDLPESILSDRGLIYDHLADDRTISFKKGELQVFQNYILSKEESISKSLKLPFLEWCGRMLRMNLARHDKKCTNPADCAINKGYDLRIQYLTRLIEDATPTQPQILPEVIKMAGNKIQWLGTQKELAELFVELKKKGWIEKFENDTIQDCFTESNSVPHYLKPGTDTKTGEHTFENLYTGYTPLFYGIKENPKRRK